MWRRPSQRRKWWIWGCAAPFSKSSLSTPSRPILSILSRVIKTLERFSSPRPQRGRYRQFTQCDIDILGEASNLAEIELILAGATTLLRLGFQGFQIRINDRQILKAMAVWSGFGEENLSNFPTIRSYLPPPPQLPPNSGMATSKMVPV